MRLLRFLVRGLTDGDLDRWNRFVNGRSRPLRTCFFIVLALALFHAIHHPPRRSVSRFDSGDEGWTIVGSGLAGPTFADFTIAAEERFIEGADPVIREDRNTPFDMVLVFDTTSSMSDSIDSMRNAAREIVAAIQAETDNFRLGLVSFRDLSESEDAITTHIFSSDVSDQLVVMSKWEASGGGDPEEDQYEGIMQALAMPWRSPTKHARVTKIIVLVTDAPPKSPDSLGNTLGKVADAAQRKGVVIYPIVVGGGAPLEMATELAEATRGIAFSAEEANEVAANVVESIGVASEQSDPWMWDAPRVFVTSISHSYGKTLSFMLRQAGGKRKFDADDVLLIGRQSTLAFDMADTPRAVWTPYAVPIHATNDWTNLATGQKATRDDFHRVLGSLQDVRIRGEFSTGPDRGALDNVKLVDSDDKSTKEMTMVIDGVSALAVILIASFGIDRIVTATLFLLSYVPWWARYFPLPETIVEKEKEKEGREEAKQLVGVPEEEPEKSKEKPDTPVAVRRALAKRNLQFAYYVMAAVLGGVVLAYFGEVRIFRAMGFDKTNVVLDCIMTGLIVTAGADRVGALVKTPGIAGIKAPAPQAVQVAGKLTLEDNAKTESA